MPSDDTHPEAARIQLEILRGLGAGKRLAIAFAMSDDVTRWSRSALRADMPGAPESAVILRWIELVYGPDLCERVRPHADRLGVRA